MSEVRPVQLETPQRQQQFIDPRTGCLTTYGHHVLTALFERTGGFDDDVWVSLGLGFQAAASQGRTDQRLQGLEGAVSSLASDVGGLRGDPRLQTADRAADTAKDALAIAMSRASPDVVRRVDELERSIAVVTGALGEVRAQTRMAQRQQAQEIEQAAMLVGFQQALTANQARLYQEQLAVIEADIEAIEADFETRARAALSGTAPVTYTEATGDIALNASLTSLGSLATGAGNFPFTTAADTWDLGTITLFGGGLLALNNAAEGRDTLGLGTRTGWSAATGTATRTTFDTASVTLPQLAERVKALIDDLIALDLIGA